MKLLVTVGTTTFDSLISAIDQCNLSGFETITVQHAAGHPSNNYDSHEFIYDIQKYYIEADLIITHAGAGSIYKLLEMQKRLLVVPNLERSDPHQKEIARFVQEQNYGCVCWDVTTMNESIEEAKQGIYVPYQSTAFFKTKDIVEMIHKEYAL